MRATNSGRRIAVLIGAALLAGCGGSGSDSDGNGGTGGSGGSSGGGGRPVSINILSNRADLVSGGDVLAEIVLPAGADVSVLTANLNGSPITPSPFTQRADGRVIGLLGGLIPGSNTLTAQLDGGPVSSATIVNHPNGGPVFSGPQLMPWVCRNAAATDAQCNQSVEYTYFYKSTDSTQSGLLPYDPANPPSDVATTTTENGMTLPFIVRQELGYQDRDQYRIAVLYQPDQPWTATAPQPQFNHKLLINHGVSCGVDHESGSAPGVLSYNPADVTGAGLPALGADATQYALGQGFAVMSTALNHSGHNCNVALQAESLVMAKERVIEQYGELRYAIGEGCSGGSLAQQWVANAYPGIYQGILPTCSFADAWGTATQFADYHLLIAYLENPSKWAPGVVWTPTQMADVHGHVTIVNAHVSDSAQFHVAVPTDPCAGVPDPVPGDEMTRYDPDTNPGGVRCSVQDAAINLLGPRPAALWGPEETAIGRGFAGFPVDNVGVQYGLAVLQMGTITPAQFLDLNAKIGGLDYDTNPIPDRTPAVEPALANAYRSGLINETNNLDRTAIIDCRGPDPALFHDSYRAFTVRARLDREHGSHANQLIWEGPAPIIGDAQCALNSFIAMDRWLAAVEQDASFMTVAEKIVANKPADLGDQCYNGLGQKVADGLCPAVQGPIGSVALGVGVVPIYATPRMVAGDSIATDTNKCQLKPLDRGDDYGPIGFNDEQWAQMQALFPDGVCDFSKPGVSQQGTLPWQTYQNAAGGVIYGGVPLSSPPANSGGGWASPAFLPAFLTGP
jgi:hypothetical protein